MVHTGDGKGKSTAAFGLALRGWNQGWSIGVFQFVKSAKWRLGEQTAFEQLPCRDPGTRRVAQDGLRLVVVAQGRHRGRPRRGGRRGLGRDQAPDRGRGRTTSTCSTSSPTRSTGAGSTSTTWWRRSRPARPPARRDHRPPRRSPAGRGRRPGHRDDQGQAPDGRRARRASGASNGERVTALPRLVVAAPATGQGKTTVATGLMAALSRAGHEVSGHKVGPDYIDPGYHALACGRPGRNLDPHLVGEERVVPLLLHGARADAADVAVIEGVMGLYDGRVGARGFSSTAHVAALTRTPVVLVVDISRSSRSIGAVVHGMATWDPTVEVAGRDPQPGRLPAPRRRGPRVDRRSRCSASSPATPTWPRRPATSAWSPPPSAARPPPSSTASRERIAETVDLDAVLDLARTAPDSRRGRRGPPSRALLTDERAESASRSEAPTRHSRPRRSAPVVAVAGGRAFTFRYAETAELLEAAGLRGRHLRSRDRRRPSRGHPRALPRRRLPRGARRGAVGQRRAPCRDPRGGARRAADRRRVRGPALPLPHPRRRADGRRHRRRGRDDERLTLRYPEADRGRRLAAHPRRRAGDGPRVPPHDGHPVAPATAPAWIDRRRAGGLRDADPARVVPPHPLGRPPQLAQRFAEAVHAHG